MAPHLTQEQRKTIVALREDGCRIREIERKTGISRPTIYFWLKRHYETGDLSTHHRQVYKRSTTAEQDDAIVDAHLEHPHLPTASTASQYNKKTVAKKLRHWEEDGTIDRRRQEDGTMDRRRQGPFRRSTTAEQDEAIIRAHHENPFRNTAEGSREFAVSTQTVRRLRAGGLWRRRNQRETIYEGKQQDSAEDSEFGFSLTDGIAEKEDTVEIEVQVAPSDIAPPDHEQPEDAEYPEDLPETPDAPPASQKVTPKRRWKKPAALDEQLKCSRCFKDIQQHTALFRCLECAEAALCWRCLPEAHKKHCVMRLPSARVYRMLESIFQQLRLEVRSRLYPDDVLGSECKDTHDDDFQKHKLNDDWDIETLGQREMDSLWTGASDTEGSQTCIQEPEITIKEEKDPLNMAEITGEESDHNTEVVQKFPTLCKVLKRNKRKPNTRPAEPNARPQRTVRPTSSSPIKVKSVEPSNNVKLNSRKRPNDNQHPSNNRQTSDTLRFDFRVQPSDSPEPDISPQPNINRQPIGGQQQEKSPVESLEPDIKLELDDEIGEVGD